MQEFGDLEIDFALERTLVSLCDGSTSRRKARDRAKAIAKERKVPITRTVGGLLEAEVLGSGFYMTRQWQQARYTALKLSNGCCQCCGRSPKEGAVLHVDHIKPKSLFPELALRGFNLQVLCGECNMGKSNRDITNWRMKF